jgi:hypothetical protein
MKGERDAIGAPHPHRLAEEEGVKKRRNLRLALHPTRPVASVHENIQEDFRSSNALPALLRYVMFHATTSPT